MGPARRDHVQITILTEPQSIVHNALVKYLKPLHRYESGAILMYGAVEGAFVGAPQRDRSSRTTSGNHDRGGLT